MFPKGKPKCYNLGTEAWRRGRGTTAGTNLRDVVDGDSWEEWRGDTVCWGQRSEISQDRKQDLIRCTKVAGEGPRDRQAADEPSGCDQGPPSNWESGQGTPSQPFFPVGKHIPQFLGRQEPIPGLACLLPARSRGCARPLVGKEVPGTSRQVCTATRAVAGTATRSARDNECLPVGQTS